MKWLTHGILPLLLLALCYSGGLTAQDGEKKPDENKDEPKKEAKKPPEEMPAYGSIMKDVRLKKVEATDVFVESLQVDPMKAAQYQQWYQQQVRSIRTPQARVQFMQQDAQKKQGIYTATPVNYRLSEKVKTRIMYPPQEYDDKGNLKKYTPKELAAMKGNSKLPGYPVAYDYLRDGHVVDIYLAKLPPTKVGAKKNPDDIPVKPDVVLIVIKAEPPRPAGLGGN